VDPIGRVRRAHFVQGRSIKAIAREFRLARNTVRDIVRGGAEGETERRYVRRAPPAAMFYYSRDRAGEHPRVHLAKWSGRLQADAYGGYMQLYDADRTPGPILEAACWAHARRPFFASADIEASARRKAEGKTPLPISPIAIALGRKPWLFAGSDRGGARAAAMYSLIVTAKMSDIDPQAWLADVLARIAGYPASRLDELLAWNWIAAKVGAQAA